MSEIDLLIEELEDIENNPIKPFVAIRIGGYLRNYKYHEYRITELEAENDELKERVAMLDVTAVFKSLGEMGYIEQVDKLNARIAELEGLVDKLIEAGDWGAKLAINIGALSGDNQYKLAKKRYDKWDALVKDWEEREE